MRYIRLAAIAGPVMGAALLAGPQRPAEADVGEREDRSTSAEYRIVEEETLLAVVTLRAGVAGRFAHDHLVHPTRYDAEISFDPEAPHASRFRLAFQTEDLVVDDRAWKDRVQDRLRELGIVDGPFQPVSESQNRDIREAMLGRGQLDAARHPRIEFRSIGIEHDGGEPFPYLIGAELTVRDRGAPVGLRGRIMERDDGRVEVEAHGRMHFTDFGIRPYSAFLGTVRVQDLFHLYARIVLEPV